MTSFALISGTLYRAPEQRTAKSGKPYVTATLIEKNGDARHWWRVTAFSETVQNELMRLDDGDACAAQGSLKAEIYEKDGEPRVSLSLVADHVLALRQPPKTRNPKTSEPPEQRTRQERCTGSWVPGAGPNDAIPFGEPR